MLLAAVTWLGKISIAFCDTVGAPVLFLGTTIKTLINTRLNVKELFAQMHRIGVQSLAITVITGAFAGAVIALQSYDGFKKFGGEHLLGALVALTMIRELGPVLTGLMVAGRAGSSIAAEIGTMGITEQIDALRTLCVNPYQYLIVPRILGAVIIMPFLALFTMVVGIMGGYIVSTMFLGMVPDMYFAHIKESVNMTDVFGGLLKSAVFGLAFSWVGCYKGYHATDGARGVGLATTQSVVVSSIAIIIANYFLAMILFGS